LDLPRGVSIEGHCFWLLTAGAASSAAQIADRISQTHDLLTQFRQQLS